MSKNSEHVCSIHNSFNRNSTSTHKAWKKSKKLVHSKEDPPFDHSSQKERSESTPSDGKDAFFALTTFIV